MKQDFLQVLATSHFDLLGICYLLSFILVRKNESYQNKIINQLSNTKILLIKYMNLLELHYIHTKYQTITFFQMFFINIIKHQKIKYFLRKYFSCITFFQYKLIYMKQSLKHHFPNSEKLIPQIKLRKHFRERT